MERITWRPELSVGIESIDDQHRQLIALVQEMETVVMEGGTRDQVQSALDAMLAYAVTHFSTEEDLFSEHGYPEMEAHVNEHNLFVLKLNGLMQQFEDDWIAAGEAILNYLLLWVKHHLGSTDKAYSRFLIDRGVK